MKDLTILVVEKVIRGKLLRDGYTVDHIKVLPFIVIEIGEPGVPTPLGGGDFCLFRDILESVICLAR